VAKTPNDLGTETTSQRIICGEVLETGGSSIWRGLKEKVKEEVIEVE
jgi:hypothetical protein